MVSVIPDALLSCVGVPDIQKPCHYIYIAREVHISAWIVRHGVGDS